MRVISESAVIKSDISDLRQLLYSQTDLDTINSRINNLNRLLELFSRQQITSSDTIVPEFLDTNPASIRLNSVDRGYGMVMNLNTSEMYDAPGALVTDVMVSGPKDILVNILNDDVSSQTLQDPDRLVVRLNRDLTLRQSVEFIITGSPDSTQNKGLDIFINTVVPIPGEVSPGNPTDTVLIGKIDLPVMLNPLTQEPGPASLWKGSGLTIDLNSPVQITPGSFLELVIDAPPLLIDNTLSAGDTLCIDNLFVTDGVSVLNMSGQYVIDSVQTGTGVVTLDTSENDTLVSFGQSQTLPYDMSGDLANIPILRVNKGYHIKVTRVRPEDNLPLEEKYSIVVKDLVY